MPPYGRKVKDNVAEQYLGLRLVGRYYVVPFFYEVAGLVEEQPQDIELVVPPFMCYLLERDGMHPGMDDLVGAAPEVAALSRAARYLVPVLLEYTDDEPVALDELVVGADVFVGVGGVHDIAEPEDVVPVPALVPAVLGGDIAAVQLS